MERRSALKLLGLAVGGLMFLPACDRWTKASVELEQPFLSALQEEVLDTFADTLIPGTDTPGAKALDVPAFVQRMLKDCYEPEVQTKVLQGLTLLEEEAQRQFSTSFARSSPEQKVLLLTTLERGQLQPAKQAEPDTAAPEATPPTTAELQQVYALLKGLVIRGYSTSEYVMQNHSNYQMMPGHYTGCVPVASPIPA